MIISDQVLQKSEKIIFTLRQLYLSKGFAPYRMSKFEEYDLYADNKDFLVSDNVITFNDIGGKLMALKPDVTLSIIKNSIDKPQETQKVYYNENIYRVSKSTGSFKEIMQTGVECFGMVGTNEICEAVSLACESMHVLSQDSVLVISDLDVLKQAIDRLSLSKDSQTKLYKAISEKNLHEAGKIISESDNEKGRELLLSLITLHGKADEVMKDFRALMAFSGIDCAAFCAVIDKLTFSELPCELSIDFSLTGDINYYNGIVFKGYLRDVPTDVLSGGQYDRLMKKLGRKSCAIGFAVYTDALERIDLDSAEDKTDNGFINVALPKGRLGEWVYTMFAQAGFECPSILEPNRKLIFENEETKVRYFWVKPSDVAIYVERGAADIGVVGKDILLEYEPDVYELLDLKKGKCKMAIAAPKGFKDDGLSTLRVATKFSNIAKTYYRTKGRDIDIIHLNGSIEIAPILGLSDVIADIVETGTTLKENNLEVIEDICPISARLISNKASFKFKGKQIEKVQSGLSKAVEEMK